MGAKELKCLAVLLPTMRYGTAVHEKKQKNNESVFKKSLDTWVIVYDRAKFYKIKWVHKNIYNT